MFVRKRLLRNVINPELRTLSKFKRLQAQRTLSAGSSSTNELLDFSKSSLGLDQTFIVPNLHAIKQLPEVENAWNNFPSKATIGDLERASNVFASFSKGGGEHLAVNALLAECQQRLGQYDDALRTIELLSSLLNENRNYAAPNTNEDLILARAKVSWTNGDFKESERLCDKIITEYDDLGENFPATNLHMASAMTGKALSQLANMNSLDQAFSVRDFFRVAIKFLERHPSSTSLPLAAAHSNHGLAEAIYNIFLEETNNVSVPMDAALKTWFQGMQKTAENMSESALDSNLTTISKTLQAALQANLAWGVLFYEHDRKDRLAKASDYAKKALEAIDSIGADEKEGIKRVLTVVASCYHQAGSAVTAEGLFQSATERRIMPKGTLPLLELRDGLSEYSKLCSEWDKREADAKKLEEEARNIDALLPDAWRGKSGLHGSLWFWVPSDFAR